MTNIIGTETAVSVETEISFYMASMAITGPDEHRAVLIAEFKLWAAKPPRKMRKTEAH